MAHDAVTGSRFVCERKYPDDPKREVFEAAESGDAGDAVLLSEVLVRMNASEIASALATETREGKFRYFTPLKVAVKHGNLACVKVLLKYKASIEIQGDENDDDDDDGNTGRNINFVLLMACEYGGHVNVVTFLVEYGAEVDFQDKQGYTPLMNASIEGHMNVVRYLVEHGANVDLQAEDGDTALMLASKYKYVKVVKFLIKHGANTNLLDKTSKTALHYAIQSDVHYAIQSDVHYVFQRGISFDVLNCFIENGSHVKACTHCTTDNSTPLMLASRHDLYNVVSYLVKHGANMDLQDKEGKTALMLAFESDHMNVVTFLVQH